MDANEIINFISTVGFPIVMCVLMFRRMEKQDDKLTTVVLTNTEQITKLCEKIDRLIDVVDKE